MAPTRAAAAGTDRAFAGGIPAPYPGTWVPGLAAFALVALALQVEEPACREPYATAELLEEVVARWDDWTPESLRAFWPDALEPIGPGPTPDERPTAFARWIGTYGRCGEMFHFTRALEGRRQYLETLEVRYAHASFLEIEHAGRAILRSFGQPFAFVADAYDPWHLGDGLRKEYRWDDPETRVTITAGRRNETIRLSVDYDRETRLDGGVSPDPTEPLSIHLRTFGGGERVPIGITCDAGLEASRDFLRRITRELDDAPGWISVVPEEGADHVIFVAAEWGDADRCVGVALNDPGQSLGRGITERAPFRDLESRDNAAAELADDLVAMLREHYLRLRAIR